MSIHGSGRRVTRVGGGKALATGGGTSSTKVTSPEFIHSSWGICWVKQRSGRTSKPKKASNAASELAPGAFYPETPAWCAQVAKHGPGDSTCAP